MTLIQETAYVNFKKKFVDDVFQLIKKMKRGYYPNLTFLSYESDIIKLIDDNPEMIDELKYLINYYYTHKYEQ